MTTPNVATRQSIRDPVLTTSARMYGPSLITREGRKLHPPNARAAILILVFGLVTIATPIIASLLIPGDPLIYLLRGVTLTAGFANVLVVTLLFLLPARPAVEPSDSPNGVRAGARGDTATTTHLQPVPIARAPKEPS